MKPETNLAAIYDGATELEQIFIKKLALFFTGERERSFSTPARCSLDTARSRLASRVEASERAR